MSLQQRRGIIEPIIITSKNVFSAQHNTRTLSFSLSLSLTHTHTHTILSLWHIHTLSLSHTHILTHLALSLSFPHMHINIGLMLSHLPIFITPNTLSLFLSFSHTHTLFFLRCTHSRFSVVFDGYWFSSSLIFFSIISIYTSLSQTHTFSSLSFSCLLRSQKDFSFFVFFNPRIKVRTTF